MKNYDLLYDVFGNIGVLTHSPEIMPTLKQVFAINTQSETDIKSALLYSVRNDYNTTKATIEQISYFAYTLPENLKNRCGTIIKVLENFSKLYEIEKDTAKFENVPCNILSRFIDIFDAKNDLFSNIEYNCLISVFDKLDYNNVCNIYRHNSTLSFELKYDDFVRVAKGLLKIIELYPESSIHILFNNKNSFCTYTLESYNFVFTVKE